MMDWNRQEPSDEREDETIIDREGWKVLGWESECDEYVSLIRQVNGKWQVCRFHPNAPQECPARGGA